jgi:hypothetical protein
VWWFVLPLLTAGGLLAAGRARCRTVMAVAVLAALSLATPYLLLIDYAAPRFLLPTYMLVALPVALCLVRLAAQARGRVRPTAAAVVALALVGHLAVQYAVLDRTVTRSAAAREDVGRIAARLHDAGVRPPCVVSGTEAVRIAFRAGCASRQIGGHDGSITRTELVRTADRTPVAVIVAGAVPEHVRDWRVVELPDLGGIAPVSPRDRIVRPVALGLTLR